MPIPTDNPAELEARLLRAIDALRQINRGLDPLITAGVDPGAIAAVAALCSRLAGERYAEVTS